MWFLCPPHVNATQRDCKIVAGVLGDGFSGPLTFHPTAPCDVTATTSSLFLCCSSPGPILPVLLCVLHADGKWIFVFTQESFSLRLIHPRLHTAERLGHRAFTFGLFFPRSFLPFHRLGEQSAPAIYLDVSDGSTLSDLRGSQDVIRVFRSSAGSVAFHPLPSKVPRGRLLYRNLPFREQACW